MMKSSRSPTISGGVSPHSSFVQAHMPYGRSRNQSMAPTGTSPSASTTSWSDRPRVTIRSGFAVISVVPYLCSTETGNTDPGSLALSAGAFPAALRRRRKR